MKPVVSINVPYRATVEEFDRISDALDAATAVWVRSGRPWSGPVFDAREAVYGELGRWNDAWARGQR